MFDNMSEILHEPERIIWKIVLGVFFYDHQIV